MKRNKNKTNANENAQVMGLKNKNMNENKNQKNLPGSITFNYQDYECNALSDSDRRAIELSRKGIFACPRYFDFFQNQDDIRMK